MSTRCSVVIFDAGCCDHIGFDMQSYNTANMRKIVLLHDGGTEISDSPETVDQLLCVRRIEQSPDSGLKIRTHTSLRQIILV